MKTANKIAIARVLSFVFGRRKTLVSRRGIRWHLDLNEGIDLSIYLFAEWERSTARALRSLVKPGDTVVDVGANIGGHALPMAKSVRPGGKVIAFEPTEFALAKLKANLELNPGLDLEIHQVALSDSNDAARPPTYPSWSLSGAQERHPFHLGVKDETPVPVRTLDSYELETVDTLKIDVDGNDLKVLRGAAETIARCQPVVIVEVAPYLLAEQGESIEAMYAWFSDRGYSFYTENGRPLSLSRIYKISKQDGSSINAVVRPARR